MRKIINIFKRFIVKLISRSFRETLAEMECSLARRWVFGAHRRLMSIQWSITPTPEFFDHQIDLYYLWQASMNSLWLERGAFGSLALKGGNVLEIACGDGFNTRNFYSLRSESIIACDFDPKAISTALKKNRAPNIKFLLADIRKEMPEGKFGNIIWDAAIEHFTPDEITKILSDIKARLSDNGILSGYTIVENADGLMSLSHHEYEFKSKQDLMRFLQPHFKNVTVFETEYKVRHNLYFWASDGIIPFNPAWSKAVYYHE
jgi:SAM-dependent methyltransferase